MPATSRTWYQDSFLSACYRLTVADAGRAAGLVGQALADDTLAPQRAFWIERHFGDVQDGASTRRFLAATAEIVDYARAQVSLTELRAVTLAERRMGPPVPTLPA